MSVTTQASAWSGKLTQKLRPCQKDILKIIQNATTRKIVIHCSRRLGKSYLLCLLAIFVCLSKSNAQVRYAAPTQKAVRKIIQPIIKAILVDCPSSIKPTWNAQEGAFIFKNGSMLHVAGVNNGHEDDLRGTDADLAIIDEAGFVDKLSYVVDSVLMPQLINTKGICIISSSSPFSPAHDFVNYIAEGKINNSYASFTIHDSDYDPAMIEEFCQEAGGSNSTAWKREYLNHLIVDDSLAIVPEWNESYVEEIQKDQFFPFYHLYAGMDIGARDLTVCIFGYYDFKRAILVIEDEISMNGPQMTTLKLKEAIQSKEKQLYADKKFYKRIADNSDPIILQDFSSIHDVHFIPTNKDSLEAMVNEMRLWVGAGRVRVHPRCKQTIGCLELGFWKTDRKMWARNNHHGHFDALAALMYLIRNVDQSTNPIPNTYGSNFNTYIPQTLLDGENHPLEQIFQR